MVQVVCSLYSQSTDCKWVWDNTFMQSILQVDNIDKDVVSFYPGGYKAQTAMYGLSYHMCIVVF
jgi:hypothetical protein